MSATAPAPDEAKVSLTHRQILVVLGGLMIGMFLAALDQTIVSTALPTIVGDLGGLDQLTYVVTAYLLTSTVGTPLFGKISDLYGRKLIFQLAIVIFLLGSILSGLSQSFLELILFRAVQGLGAGGLIALTQTIVGDIVPARERGRYQGYIGSVFALASVAGPLLGGFFVDSLSWRFIFYINVPLGLIALAVTNRVLRLPFQRREAAVDYLGAALMVAGVSSLLLVSVWGGTQYAWGSPIIIALIAIGVIVLAAFVWWEHRASEPIVPPRLFSIGVFRVSGAASFIIGMGMFGAIVFLPLFLQIVTGASATSSGLLLLPLIAGLMFSVIGSGQLITRTGRYKIFPILGTALLAVGLYLLSTMGPGVTRLQSSLYMVVVGLGIGLVLQVLILAVQNAVGREDLGVATATTTFFRSFGGTVGTAVFGALLANRLAVELPKALHAAPGGSGAKVDVNVIRESPAQLDKLPPAVHHAVIQGFANSIDTVFLVGVPIALVGFAIVWFLKEQPLRLTANIGRDDVERAAAQIRPNAGDGGQARDGAPGPEGAPGDGRRRDAARTPT